MPTKDELLSFWARAYARSSLLEAKGAIEELQKGGHTDAIRRALILTVVIAYYRSFTEARVPGGKKIVPLSASYIPKPLSSVHEDLGKLRHRVFGHKDASEIGPDGTLHKVLLRVDGTALNVHTLVPIDASGEFLARTAEACDAIIKRIDVELTDFLWQHAKQKIPSGVYEVLLDDASGAWIKQLS